MKRRWWRVFGLLVLASMALLAGCAPGGAYRGPESAGGYSRDVPPSLLGTDPALREWYSAPYFMPYEMP
jgi:hypothetical protein